MATETPTTPAPDPVPLPAVRETQELAPRERSMLEVIAEASRDETVDVNKFERMMAIMLELEKQKAKTAYMQSMNACQNELKPIVRDAKNEHTGSKYARLETVDAAIRPVITKHGFSLSFNNPDIADGKIKISCTCFHTGGHSEYYELTGGLDMAGALGKANKTPIQALGSTVSYLRRYLKLMIFDLVLVNEDNDGNRTTVGATINAEQVDNLECLIQEIGLDERARANFLTLMEAKTLSEIKADRFRQACLMLDGRRRKGSR